LASKLQDFLPRWQKLTNSKRSRRGPWVSHTGQVYLGGKGSSFKILSNTLLQRICP